MIKASDEERPADLALSHMHTLLQNARLPSNSEAYAGHLQGPPQSAVPSKTAQTMCAVSLGSNKYDRNVIPVGSESRARLLAHAYMPSELRTRAAANHAAVAPNGLGGAEHTRLVAASSVELPLTWPR